ncbi:MAG TPA: transcriptional activator RfaH [Pseudolabrys sp.]
MLQNSTISAQSGVIGDCSNDAVSRARWYVVHTQCRAENQAAKQLEKQGYQVFCPRYRRTVRHSRKTKSVLAPLFPNYLFVRLDISRDRWRSINGTRGVVRLLMQGEAPQPVPDDVMNGLRAQTRTDGTFEWTANLKVGGPVRIVNGPFAEFLGTLQSLNAAGRVQVLLNLLGRSVSVALRSECLFPVS